MSASVKHTKKVVPWFDKEEWNHVYLSLFCNDPVKQRHAVDRLAVWKCRSARLPAGIEITWQLMSALIQDRDDQEGSNRTILDQQIRLSYSLAIIRFVNHLTEMSLSRPSALPVHKAASNLGLPMWLVALRHDATHANLPALPLLRSATQFSLAWIKREYWDHQAEGEVEQDDVTPIVKQVSDYLVSFMQNQFQRGKDTRTGEKRQKQDVDVEKLSRPVSRCRDQSVKLLCEEGYLLPSSVQLETLGINSQELMESPDLSLPQVLVKFWKPVLCVFQEQKCIPLLLCELAEGLSENSTLSDRLRAGWITTVVIALSKSDCGFLRQLNTKETIDAHCLLRLCVGRPNVYTEKLISCLLRRLDTHLTEDQSANLLSLVRCYYATSDDSPENRGITSDTLYTAESLSRQTENNGHVSHSEHRVELSPDIINWAKYPIGSCPNIMLGPCDLELDALVDRLQGDSESVPTPRSRSPSVNHEQNVDRCSNVEESMSSTIGCDSNERNMVEQLKKQISLYMT